MGPTQNPDPASYKLTSEDYENIWLRIKDKTQKQIYKTYGFAAAVVTIIAFIFISNLYTYSKEIVSHFIGDYVKSDNFRQQLKATFQDQFTIVDNKLKLIDGGLKKIDDGLGKIEIYKSAPMNISDYGFTLVDQRGNYILVEYGKGNSSSYKFKSKYKQPPIVTASVMSNPWASHSIRGASIGVSSITKDGFYIDNLSVPPHEIQWIAIGK